MRRIIYYMGLLFLLSGCEKIYYYPDRPIVNVETKFLAHHAGGNSQYQPNTYDAAVYGFEKLDGIEVDIQLSKNRTIWLSHDYEFLHCDNIKPDCFSETRDEEIIRLDSCLGEEYSFSRLEDIFKVMHDSFPGSYISLDVKVWTPCKFSSLDIISVMNTIGEQIIILANKYNLGNFILVESELATFLNYIKKRNNDIDCYLTTLGDFERGMLLALKESYDGISFKYDFDEKITSDHISLLHKKGLKIQLWTINEISKLGEAYIMNPDFIQTDDLDYPLAIKNQ